MIVIVNLQTTQIVVDRHGIPYVFGSRAEAEKWQSNQHFCDSPFFVELPDNGAPTSTELAANRAAVASKLKHLAEKNGGYDVLQSALEFLRA